jgi:hypothetical protein
MILRFLHALFGGRNESEDRDSAARELGRCAQQLYLKVNGLGPSLGGVPSPDAITWHPSEVEAFVALAQRLDTSSDHIVTTTAKLIRGRLIGLTGTLGRTDTTHSGKTEALHDYNEHRADLLRCLSEIERLRSDGVAVLDNVVHQLRKYRGHS